MKCDKCIFVEYCEVCGRPIYPNKGQMFPPNYIDPNKVFCKNDSINCNKYDVGDVRSCGDTEIKAR